MYCELQRDTFRVQVISGKAYVVGEMKQYMSRQWHLKIQIQEASVQRRHSICALKCPLACSC